MQDKSISIYLIFGVSILAGLFLLGFFIYRGLKTFSDKDRVVTVKGLAEMNMAATSASMTIQFAYSGDNLKEVLALTEKKKNAIIAYLNNAGYTMTAIKVNNVDVEDRQRY
jgi:hypothetical protein